MCDLAVLFLHLKRNPAWGCPRIAPQIAVAFGMSLDKDVVRRMLAARYRSSPGSAGPSWLTTLVERRIGTLRREYLDRTLFWTAADLKRKLLEFQQYYNGHRAHAGRAGRIRHAQDRSEGCLGGVNDRCGKGCQARDRIRRTLACRGFAAGDLARHTAGGLPASFR